MNIHDDIAASRATDLAEAMLAAAGERRANNAQALAACCVIFGAIGSKLPAEGRVETAVHLRRVADWLQGFNPTTFEA